MRDPEERQRHFVIRDKKEENYDQPAVRRRGLMREEDEEREEQEEKPRRPRARRTLREREMEEEEEVRSLRGSRKRKTMKRAEIDDEEDYEDDEEQRPRAPKIVRIFAWIALVVILFTCGYVATNYFFAWSDKQGGERIGSVYGSGAEVAETAAEQEPAPSNAQYSIYVPDGQSFQTRAIELKPGATREDDIQRVLSMYIDSLKETKAMDPRRLRDERLPERRMALRRHDGGLPELDKEARQRQSRAGAQRHAQHDARQLPARQKNKVLRQLERNNGKDASRPHDGVDGGTLAWRRSAQTGAPATCCAR